MSYYTAKQIVDVLQNEGISMPLRTVRYYTQIGLIPPLDTVEKKRCYSSKHLLYFRAILTLSKTGETLAAIREKLENLSLDEIKKIGNQLSLYQMTTLTAQETTKINDDVFITLSNRVQPDVRHKIIETVTQMMRKDDRQ